MFCGGNGENFTAIFFRVYFPHVIHNVIHSLYIPIIDHSWADRECTFCDFRVFSIEIAHRFHDFIVTSDPIDSAQNGRVISAVELSQIWE